MVFHDEKSVKRLVIFFFYDKDGIVDRYVPYLLKDLRRNCRRMVVVCNGKLTCEGRRDFAEIAGSENVFVRENTGFDVWAYKSGLEFVGWENVRQYDEVVFANFTIFGPLYPFSEMFSAMDRRDVDFWGISKHYGTSRDFTGCTPWGYIPEHIQSSFICVRKSMLVSREFQEYWNTRPMINSYLEAIGRHEAIFTRTFNEKGFKSDVYVETDDLRDVCDYPLVNQPVEVIKNRRCPVFKRKSFDAGDWIFNVTAGEHAAGLYEYVRENFDYDLSMVWENILRTFKMASIKDCLGLNYVLPYHALNKAGKSSAKVALCMHLYYKDLVGQCLEYAKAMPSSADVYITVISEEMEKYVGREVKVLAPRNCTVIRIENRGRDVSSMWIGCKPYIGKYDYVCAVHDKKVKQMLPLSLGDSWSYKCFDNLLGSKEYVQNIISHFDDNPQLGVLMPPPPIHGTCFQTLISPWAGNYANTLALAKKLNLKINVDEASDPVSPLGTMFWFRTKAFKPLLEYPWKFEDFPNEPNNYDGTILHAVERLYSPMAQAMGYYSAWCMNDRYARFELSIYHSFLRRLSQTVAWRFGKHPSMWQMLDGLNSLQFPQSAPSSSPQIVEKIVEKEPSSIEDAIFAIKKMNIFDADNLGVVATVKCLVNRICPLFFRDFARARAGKKWFGLRKSLKIWRLKHKLADIDSIAKEIDA